MLLTTLGRVAILLLMVVLLGSCAVSPSCEKGVKPQRYQVQRLDGPITIDADWDKPCWRKVKPLCLTYHIINEPDPVPKVQAKVLYDDDNLYVIFRAEDHYVKAIAQKPNSRVSGDSAVEFFFTPGPDIAKGYVILEINCIGTMLFAHADTSWQDHQFVDEADAKKIEIAHSLPEPIETEIEEPTTWTLEFRIPLEMINKYRPIIKPAPGVIWRANFYKLASDTTHPHYFTWSQIVAEKPHFHMPKFFGILEFTE